MRFTVPRTKYAIGLSALITLMLAGLNSLDPRPLPPRTASLFLLVGAVASLALGWRMSRKLLVEVSRDGIVLYRVNRIAWHEITDAKPRRLIGLQYLKLYRAQGRPWWLPLFMVGDGSIRAVLRDLAPEGHPVRTCLARMRAAS